MPPRLRAVRSAGVRADVPDGIEQRRDDRPDGEALREQVRTCSVERRSARLPERRGEFRTRDEQERVRPDLLGKITQDLEIGRREHRRPERERLEDRVGHAVEVCGVDEEGRRGDRRGQRGPVIDAPGEGDAPVDAERVGALLERRPEWPVTEDGQMGNGQRRSERRDEVGVALLVGQASDGDQPAGPTERRPVGGLCAQTRDVDGIRQHVDRCPCADRGAKVRAHRLGGGDHEVRSAEEAPDAPVSTGVAAGCGAEVRLPEHETSATREERPDQRQQHVHVRLRADEDVRRPTAQLGDESWSCPSRSGRVEVDDLDPIGDGGAQWPLGVEHEEAHVRPSCPEPAREVEDDAFRAAGAERGEHQSDVEAARHAPAPRVARPAAVRRQPTRAVPPLPCETRPMARVIELFGAPGTGKSSLLRALEGRRVAGRRVVAAGDLARVPRSGPLGLLLHRDLSPAERRGALAARRDDWSELLALIGAAPLGRDGEDPFRPLHAPGWLGTTLELRALADAADDGCVVVLDEGLVQRTAVVCGSDPDDDTLDRYLRALPEPALHVHLTQDPAVLVARLRGRERMIDRHVGLDDMGLAASVDNDLRLMARCAAGLEVVGAPVRTFVTSDDVESTAAQVLAEVGAALGTTA